MAIGIAAMLLSVAASVSSPESVMAERTSAASNEGSGEPRLLCEIAADEEAEGVERSESGRIQVSNLAPISLHIELQPAGLGSEPLEISTSEGGDGALVIEVVELRDGERVPVLAEVAQQSVSQREATTSLQVSLNIPLTEEEREAALEKFLGHLEEESRKAGRLEEFQRLTADKEALLRGLGGLQRQNRAGEFEVRCKYRSAGPEGWEGEIEAAPLPIEVRFDGGAFDGVFSPPGGGAAGDPAP